MIGRCKVHLDFIMMIPRNQNNQDQDQGRPSTIKLCLLCIQSQCFVCCLNNPICIIGFALCNSSFQIFRYIMIFNRRFRNIAAAAPGPNPCARNTIIQCSVCCTFLVWTSVVVPALLHPLLVVIPQRASKPLSSRPSPRPASVVAIQANWGLAGQVLSCPTDTQPLKVSAIARRSLLKSSNEAIIAY